MIYFKRILTLFIIVLIFNVILILNLYYIQILYFRKYYFYSNINYIRITPTIPNRGIIYDTNGIIIATNKIIHKLELITKKKINLIQDINNLCLIINININNVNLLRSKIKYFHNFSSLSFKDNLTYIEQANFYIHQYHFFNFRIKQYIIRYYPFKSILTHVIGYISEKKNNKKKIIKNKSIFFIKNKIINNIGTLGIESFYNKILYGKPGFKIIEINNTGIVKRILYKKLPQKGKNIILTIDVNIQQYITKLFKNSKAIVLLLNKKGNIISLISNPSYNSNIFISNNITYKKYISLSQNINFPFINRVIQGIYPLASTIKPYISIAALNTGYINKNYTIFDPGWWKIPKTKKRYRDWKNTGHGFLNTIKAIEESSDTFFYQIASDININQIYNWIINFGYGKYTNIDLVAECSGIIITSNLKNKKNEKKWFLGDTIAIGIGQGYWTTTPLQISKSLLILINDGKIYTPHLLNGILEKKQIILYNQSNNIKIKNNYLNGWQIIKYGMYSSVNNINGKLNKIFYNTPLNIGIKSGTAQIYNLKKNEIYNFKNISNILKDHKLMIAFAPFNKPTIAIIVILENGGLGNKTTGEIINRILNYYIFLKK